MSEQKNIDYYKNTINQGFIVHEAGYTPNPLNLEPTNQNFANQSSHATRARQLKYMLQSQPKIEPIGVYVGELQEKWQFPSDHLPIGFSINGLNIVSWNILNPVFMDYVLEKNSQGLSRSILGEENIYPPDSSITLREIHVLDFIETMCLNQDIISLQECGAPFLAELEKRLPPNFKIAYEKSADARDQSVTIYNSNKLDPRCNRNMSSHNRKAT